MASIAMLAAQVRTAPGIPQGGLSGPGAVAVELGSDARVAGAEFGSVANTVSGVVLTWSSTPEV